MDEPPAQALRYKKDSSMRVAVNLVKSGEAHACVSAGNTGALMAISRFVLKTLPGIDRPAIATVLPNMKRTNTYVLDLGANVDCTAEHLLQFGIMGAMLVAAVEHKERPDGRPAQHRRRGHQGQRGGEAGRRAAARERPQLLRQRRRRRHLQGHRRRGGVRRLRRQRGAQGLRGRGGRCSTTTMREEFSRNALHQARGAGRDAGAARVPRPRSTTGATTAPACSGCAASSSRATARPTRSPSARRSSARWTRCATACRSASPSAWRSCSRAAAQPQAPGAMIYSRIAGTGSYLPRAGRDQRRVRRAPRHERRLDPRAHRHRAAPHRGRSRRPRATSRCEASQRALCRRPASPRTSST